MWNVIFADIAKTQYQNSRNITESLTKLQLEQTTEYNINRDEFAKLKYNIKKEKLQQNMQRNRKASKFDNRFTNQQNSCKENYTREGGIHVTINSTTKRRKSLSKQEFWDLVKIWYGWPLSRLPILCSCGAKYDLQQSLSCEKGGFVPLRHNYLSNMTAYLTYQVCTNVWVELSLQILIGETFDSRSRNARDEAWLDIGGSGFWTKYQITFFDISAFDPNPKIYEGKTLQQCYKTNEVNK